VPTRKAEDSIQRPADVTEFAAAVWATLKEVWETVLERSEAHGPVWNLDTMGEGRLAAFTGIHFQDAISGRAERIVHCLAMVDHKEWRWVNDIMDEDSLLDGIAYRCGLRTWLDEYKEYGR